MAISVKPGDIFRTTKWAPNIIVGVVYHVDAETNYAEATAIQADDNGKLLCVHNKFAFYTTHEGFEILSNETEPSHVEV